MRYIDQMDIAGKTLLLRVDLNVPLDKGKVADDARIRSALPTIKYALDKGSKVIVISHLDRPGGKVVPDLSLAMVGRRLSELLRLKVGFPGEITGRSVKDAINAMPPHSVVMLENLRFDPREEKNDDPFSKELASYAEIYIDDAFANAHRRHASNVGVTRYFDEKGGGLLMKRELETLGMALDSPKRPLMAVIGGAKVASKIELLVHMSKMVDKMLLGGAMAFPFLKAKGFEIGSYEIPEDVLATARTILDADGMSDKIVLPLDLVMADRKDESAAAEVVPVVNARSNKMALDIGPRTIDRFREVLNDAGTIIWNGPMGVFEMEQFSAGTHAIAEAIADSDAFTLVGGGDTNAVLDQYWIRGAMSYVSTGGGAFLEMLAGRELPAVAALELKDEEVKSRTRA